MREREREGGREGERERESRDRHSERGVPTKRLQPSLSTTHSLSLSYSPSTFNPPRPPLSPHEPARVPRVPQGPARPHDPLAPRDRLPEARQQRLSVLPNIRVNMCATIRATILVTIRVAIRVMVRVVVRVMVRDAVMAESTPAPCARHFKSSLSLSLSFLLPPFLCGPAPAGHASSQHAVRVSVRSRGQSESTFWTVPVWWSCRRSGK